MHRAAPALPSSRISLTAGLEGIQGVKFSESAEQANSAPVALRKDNGGSTMAKDDRTEAEGSVRKVGVYDRPDGASQKSKQTRMIIGIVIAVIIAVLLWLWLT
jgi:hypothetical protein